MAAQQVGPASMAAPAIANPAPLGLAGFALTTFLLSAHNAIGNSVPLLVFFGFAVFYGGLAQFMAGMMEFRAGNTFGATAFTTYGAFWLGVAATVILVLAGKLAAADVNVTLAWILLAFAIFNTYMLLWSMRVSVAVFLVFLTLEITEILLFIGKFNGQADGTGLVALGGWVGIITAIVAWYTSAAGVVNAMAAPNTVLPVGSPMWTGTMASSSASPMARTTP
ncbi:MAG TPA: acetate uptake transporter [Candidatus Dormibacteraeota bacterium]